MFHLQRKLGSGWDIHYGNHQTASLILKGKGKEEDQETHCVENWKQVSKECTVAGGRSVFLRGVTSPKSNRHSITRVESSSDVRQGFPISLLLLTPSQMSSSYLSEIGLLRRDSLAKVEYVHNIILFGKETNKMQSSNHLKQQCKDVWDVILPPPIHPNAKFRFRTGLHQVHGLMVGNEVVKCVECSTYLGVSSEVVKCVECSTYLGVSSALTS
ncbi:unnamed protein product [Schistosoma margrebowiei]|uniref:Uncharacterized protein n=1 Tax=Schistosoma margrebowiei TaxID=48269 RepID=A0A183NBP1_9TREM|nr:unnamed protein product [Schistosoma margrebowiei]